MTSYISSKHFNIQMTQVKSFQASNTFNALKHSILKSIPSLLKYILATQCIQITPFQSPMNHLIFKLCAFSPIHWNKGPFQLKNALVVWNGLWLSNHSSQILFTTNKSSCSQIYLRTIKFLKLHLLHLKISPLPLQSAQRNSNQSS